MRTAGKSPQRLRATIENNESEKYVFNDKYSENNQITQEFGDISLIINYLNNTAGCTIQGIGQEDDRVRQSVEANIGQLIIRYIVEVDFGEENTLIKWESEDTFRYWSGTKWLSGGVNTMEVIIDTLLKECNVGIVYSFYSPSKIAPKVMKALVSKPNKKYTPTTEYIGFANGVLNLNTMELQPFDMRLMPRFNINFDFDEAAKCPKFESCIKQALDEDTAKVLQEAFGNLLLDNRHEKIAVLCGGGCDGKSTILDAVTEALGRKDVTSYNLNAITQTSGQAIANMRGKLANICYDSGNLKIGNEDLLKCYASGEPMPCKVLYKQPTMTEDYPKTILALNNLPQTSDYSHGFFRRLLIIPFQRKIPKSEININMKKELKAERQGIINWLLIGLQRLKEQGSFSDSQTIDRATNQYRTDSDSVACFLQDYNYQPTEEPSILLSELYSEFCEWQRKSGYQSMTNRKFAARLRLLNIKVEKKNIQIMVWIKRHIPDDGLPF